MTGCGDVRDLFSPYVEGELTDDARRRVEEHLDRCSSCSETLAAVRLVIEAGREVAKLEPPSDLEGRLTTTPCARWLDLLFRAVDHEVEPPALQRLLVHLESCVGCRRTWDDLSLMHQVGAALTPSPRLVARCDTVHQRPPRASRRVLGVRTATAAAYLLAVLTTLVIGNPVTLARYRALGAVQQATEVVSGGVGEVASSGRGEVRVMVWRAWQWGRRQLKVLTGSSPEGKTESSSGSTAETTQGGKP